MGEFFKTVQGGITTPLRSFDIPDLYAPTLLADSTYVNSDFLNRSIKILCAHLM